MEHTYLCIDLKSFFASVEAVSRGLDPFQSNLIVADPSRGEGSICLAITPAMKKLGVKNRCRVFEIPKNIDYITAVPRMNLYLKTSAEIYSIYLRYVSCEDIHVYSIDECFIDISSYLHLYDKTPKEFACMLMDAVMSNTGICATCGIGSNLFLAKLALDITAKHSLDNIGYLDPDLFKQQIWHHRPLTDIWGIGLGISQRLAKFKAFDLYSVTKIPEELLYKEFGINAELIIDHAHGIEPCTIKDIHTYKPKSNSISNSQILFEDYSSKEALLIVKEMLDILVLELTEKNMLTNNISLYVGYSKHIHNTSGGSKKLHEYTCSYQYLVSEFESLFYSKIQKKLPIRKITLSLNNIIDSDLIGMQPNLFSGSKDYQKEKRLQQAVVDIKNKFGKNSLLRGISFESKATARLRNKLIGGHNSE